MLDTLTPTGLSSSNTVARGGGRGRGRERGERRGGGRERKRDEKEGWDERVRKEGEG